MHLDILKCPIFHAQVQEGRAWFQDPLVRPCLFGRRLLFFTFIGQVNFYEKNKEGVLESSDGGRTAPLSATAWRFQKRR